MHPVEVISVNAEDRLIAVRCPMLLRAFDNAGLPCPTIDGDPGSIVMHWSSIVLARKMGFAVPVPDEAKSYVEQFMLSISWRNRLAPKDSAFSDLLASMFADDCKPMPHQVVAVAAAVRRCWFGRWGMILADEAGLGKTCCSLGLFAWMRSRGHITNRTPAVVFAPASVASQWKDESLKFLKHKPVVSLVQGTGARKVNALQDEEADLFILTWELLTLDRYRPGVSALLSRSSLVVGDESGRIKSTSSKTHKSFVELASRVPAKLLLNATPMEVDAADLWSQMRPLDHRCLGARSLFANRYLVTIPTRFGEKIVGHKHLSEFRLRVSSTTLRRTREECGISIPVDAIVRRVELCPKQRKAYDLAVDSLLGDSKTGSVAATKIAAVQRALWSAIESDPCSPSAKFDALLDLIKGELKGERIVAFTRLATIARDCHARLNRAGVRARLITGDQSMSERSRIRRAFEHESSAGSVIVGTEAAERGMNLQTASIVVHLDLPWTYARLRQRVGRVSRIGQKASSCLSVSLAGTLQGRKSLDDWMLGLVKRRQADSLSAVGDDSGDELGAIDVDALRSFLRSF